MDKLKELGHKVVQHPLSPKAKELITQLKTDLARPVNAHDVYQLIEWDCNFRKARDMLKVESPTPIHHQWGHDADGNLVHLFYVKR